MKVTKKSQVTGVTHTIEMDVTEEQIQAWQTGTLIQNAMPNLTADEREFLMTGITSEEWNSLWSADEDYIKNKKELPYL